MNKIDTKKLVSISILIAINVILTRHLSIQTELLRISFNFIPIALTSALYGPRLGGIASVIADTIGMILFPFGNFFFGFTLSAFLIGYIFGLFFYEKEITIKRIVLASLVVAVGVGLGLNTLWVSILSGTGYLALLKIRGIQAIITLVLYIVVLNMTLNRLVKVSKAYA